jgi:hypothetical protein
MSRENQPPRAWKRRGDEESYGGDFRRSGTFEQKGNRAQVPLVEETWVLMRVTQGVESMASLRGVGKKIKGGSSNHIMLHIDMVVMENREDLKPSKRHYRNMMEIIRYNILPALWS